MTLRPLHYDAVNQRLAEAVNGAINPASIAGLAGHNYLINGDFRFWQRATTSAAAAARRYVADRWEVWSAGSTTQVDRMDLQTTSGVSPLSAYAQRITIVSVTGANNYALVRQHIEDVRILANGKATVSFWVWADAPAKIGISIDQNFGAGGSAAVVGVGQSFNVSSAWTLVTATFDLASVAGLTIGAGSAVTVNIWFDAGSNNATRSGTVGRQSGAFWLANAQVEFGDAATRFDPRPDAIELALCQRYFQNDTTSFNGTTRVNLGTAFFFSATRADAIYTFKQPMRVPPAVTFAAAASWRVLRSGGAAVVSAISAGEVSTNNMYVTATVSGQTAATPGVLQTTDAAASGTGLTLDAEL